jgi:hypothetical protein
VWAWRLHQAIELQGLAKAADAEARGYAAQEQAWSVTFDAAREEARR